MAGVPTGIRARHRSACRSHSGGRCSCRPSWEAVVGSGRTGKIRQTFPTLAAARTWRADALLKIGRGELRTESAQKVRDAAKALMAGMEAGSVRTRSGHTYKPSAIRSYDEALNAHVLPYLGAMRLSRVRRADVQALADRLVAAGKAPSTVRNALLPLRVIYRRAIRDGAVTVNPCIGVDLPAVTSSREDVPDAAQAARMVAALPEADRALWATGLYAGLRRGELRGLVWHDVDLAAGVIHVRRALDARGATIRPKSKAGERTVPIPRALRGHLLEQRLRNGGATYVFGRGEKPPPNGSIQGGLHICRHAYASFMIGAGVNAKTLSTYMGHASITVTIDRYGHLFPGNEAEAADMLDAYLEGRKESQ
jgi:integrase